MNVTREDGAFGAKRFELRGKLREDSLRLGCILHHDLADVDHSCAGAHEIGSHHRRFSDGCDDDIGAARDARQVPAFRMTNRDGRVGVEQQQRHWFSHDIAAPDHHGVRAFDRNIAAAENLHHADRCAGHQPRTVGEQVPDIHGMKAVHILRGNNGVENFFGVDLLGQRHLHENTVHVVPLI